MSSFTTVGVIGVIGVIGVVGRPSCDDNGLLLGILFSGGFRE